MIAIIRAELYKIFTKKRSFVSFGAIFIIVLIAQAAMLWEGEAMHSFLTKNLSEAFYMQGNLVNGYLMTFIILNFLWVHVPLLIVIVTGDLFSGESHNGTFRLLLSRPVSRTALVTAKFIAAITYTFVLMLFFALISLALGIAVFGTGDLMVIFNNVNIIPENDLMWRFVLAFTFGFIGMSMVASFSLFLSSTAENSLSPILITMATLILFTLISSFNFQIFKYIKPILFTTYLDSWQLLFSYEVNASRVIRDALILAIQSLVFYIATLVYFNKKDILT